MTGEQRVEGLVRDLRRLEQALMADQGATVRAAAEALQRAAQERRELLDRVQGLVEERQATEQGVLSALATTGEWAEGLERAARAVASDEELEVWARRYELLVALRDACRRPTSSRIG